MQTNKNINRLGLSCTLNEIEMYFKESQTAYKKLFHFFCVHKKVF